MKQYERKERMKVNWLVRFKNKIWLGSFLSLIVGFVYSMLALFDVFPEVTESLVLQLMNQVLGGKVEVALLASSQIKTRHSHLGYLMAGHHTHLSGIRSHLLAGNVSIATGNVKELTLASSLPVGHGALYHMAEVIQLERQVFLLHPTAVA